jgi:hypothetical protein
LTFTDDSEECITSVFRNHSSCCLVVCLFDFLYEPEDISSTLLQNVHKIKTDCTVANPGRTTLFMLRLYFLCTQFFCVHPKILFKNRYVHVNDSYIICVSHYKEFCYIHSIYKYKPILLLLLLLLLLYLYGLLSLACSHAELINSEITDLTYSSWNSLVGGSARSKAATYTEETRTGSDAPSGFRNHDQSVLADEDISCRHCDQYLPF